MAARDLIPGTDPALARWIVHFASKIDAHASVLSITKDDVVQLKADAAMVDWVVKVLPSLRASSQQLTAYKNDLFDGQPGGAPKTVPAALTFPAAPAAVPDGIVSRTRALTQRIKKSPGYTDAIGKDLGLIAVAPLVAVVPKPTFRGTALPQSEVRLDWVKGSHSGVLIQGKRPGDTDWVALGQDNYSPYVDGRPPVTPGVNETRQYRMRYLDKDDEVGEWSDIVTVVTIA